MDIDKLIESIKDTPYFPAIQRYSSTISVDDALRVVRQIGMSRTPRFVIDDENTFAYTNIIRWYLGKSFKCLNPTTKQLADGRLDKGIYIAGNTGSGKSWCMEIINALANVLRNKISFSGDDDEADKMSLHIVRADDIVSDYQLTGNIERYKRASILTIQDLGQEQLEAMYMGNRLNVLKSIIEYRGDFANKITCFTSNYPINHSQLCDMYGDRVASRLIEMCNYYEIKGSDRRKL